MSFLQLNDIESVTLVRDFSVWPIWSESFQSGDILVRLLTLAEILHVLILMQTYLNQREVLFKKNFKHDPRSNS